MESQHNPGSNEKELTLRPEQILPMLTRALDASNIAIAIVDGTKEELPVLFANPAFDALTRQFCPVENPALIRLLECGEAEDGYVLTPGALLAKDSRLVMRYRLEQGDFSCKELTVCPMESYQLAVLIRDITEQRFSSQELANVTEGLEETVRERTAELERTNQDLEGFTYSVSHDLRAPLRAIMGFSKVLIEDYGRELDSGMLQNLDRIGAAANRMSKIIEDLLTFSRLGRKEVVKQKLDLSEMVRTIRTDWMRRNPDLETRLEIDDGAEAMGDPTLIRLALENLIDNAYKFTSKEEMGLVEFRRLGDNRFVVRDNGVGFDPLYSDKLFSPFERLHSAKDYPGTGIGLSNVRRILERHGGKVWAEGSPGHGAAFYFEL